MSIRTPARVPQGVRSGGQFTTGARSEPSVSLDETDPNELANLLGDGADWDTADPREDGSQSLQRWRQEQHRAAGAYRSAQTRLEKASVGTAATAIRNRYPTAHEVKMHPGDQGLFNLPSEVLAALGHPHHRYPFMHVPPGQSFPRLNISDALRWAQTLKEHP